MGGYNLVLDSEVVQCHNIVNGPALEGVQIFNGVNIVLVPFELKSRAIGNGSLNVALVEQVIDSLLVDL